MSSADKDNNKLTYAQVAASPPSSHGDDENETRSNGESDNQQFVGTLEGSRLSKPKENEDAAKGTEGNNPTKGSVSSAGSSEPEMINVEPPIPPPVDKMKPQPKPVKKEEPVVDNLTGDCAPLKHTTMLTVKKSGKDSAEVKVDDSELEIVSEKNEKERRLRNRLLIAGSGVLLVALVGVGVWKWTTRKSAH